MTIDCYWKWFLDSGGISGIVSGIVSGLLVAGFLWFLSWSRRRARRKAQVNRLRDLVLEADEKIKNEKDSVLETDSRKKIPVSGDAIRKVIFDATFRSFRNVLLYEALDLLPEERSTALKVADDCSGFLQKMGQSGQIPKGKKFYDQQFFDRLRELAWLNLPEKES